MMLWLIGHVPQLQSIRHHTASAEGPKEGKESTEP